MTGAAVVAPYRPHQDERDVGGLLPDVVSDVKILMWCSPTNIYLRTNEKQANTDAAVHNIK